MNDSPSIETLVLDFVAAAAKISTKRLVSCAVIPKAVRASVTMSDTVPSSSPEAAASCMTPLRPAVMDAASHPAMLIYCMASDASCAVNFVAAPISLAFAVRDSISLAVAPESASTVDMED